MYASPIARSSSANEIFCAGMFVLCVCVCIHIYVIQNVICLNFRVTKTVFIDVRRTKQNTAEERPKINRENILFQGL